MICLNEKTKTKYMKQANATGLITDNLIIGKNEAVYSGES